jgi:GT2 family glycosyltransferase
MADSLADMPFFSTIIAAYNRGNLICATLDSAISQSETDEQLQEIIIIDDGSTDDTFTIAQEYESRYPGQIRALRQPNAGPGPARNRGLVEARGEYVCFLDSDDLWFPWTLKTYRTVIERENHPSFIIATALPFDDEAMLRQIAESSLAFDIDPDFYSTAPIDLWHGCSAVVARTDALRSVGGFVDRNINAEDTDLWMKMGTAPGFVHIRSPITVGYREHAMSAVGDTNKTRDGMLHLINQERQERYPGGCSRRKERRTMLTRHIRAASMQCLRARQRKDAWLLYRSSFAWNVRLGRIKYLSGFPLADLMSIGLRSS